MGIKGMQEKDSPKFLLGEDSDVHDGMLQDELQELKMEKLSHRVSLLAILIPCMIGIIVVIAYLDIKDRVTRAQDTGAIGSQKLASDIESKFSSLSLEQAKIKDTLSKLPSLEDASAFAQSRLKNMQDSLKQMESSSISRNELSQALQDLNAKYEGLPAAMETELQTLEKENHQLAEEIKELSGRLAQLAESLKKISAEMKGVDERIAAMEEGKISKSELDFALRLKEIENKQLLLEAVAPLEKKIQSLEEKVRVIQKEAGGLQQNRQSGSTSEPGSLKKEARGASQETEKTAEPAAPVQTAPEQTFDATLLPVQPEGIVEQNIE
jgi:chromosome segregation ATPase